MVIKDRKEDEKAPLEIELSPPQQTHVHRMTTILRNSPFAIDLSKLGAGKTYTASYIARHLGMEDIVVVCPVSVKPKWLSMKSTYGLPISQIMSYCELRSPTFVEKSKLLSHRKYTVERRRERDNSIYYLPKEEYTAKPEWVTRVRRGGTLVIFDEIQNLKNKSSQFLSGKALLAPVVDPVPVPVVEDADAVDAAAGPSRSSRSSSKALLLSGTPLDKHEQAVTLFQTIGVMKRDELSSYNPGTGILTHTGLREIQEYCARISPNVFAIIPAMTGSGGATSRYVFEMFDKIVKVHLASGMPAPPCTAVIHKYNATYDAEDDDQMRRIVEAVENLSSACNYDPQSRSVNLARGANAASMGHIVSSLMKIEEAKMPTFKRIVHNRLKDSMFQKVVVGVNYCSSVQYLRRELAQWDPLVMTGSLSASQRERVLLKFQETNTKHRLIIGNISVCSTGIDLDDKDGRFRRMALVSPNYSNITLYQFGQRLLRANTRSDSHLHYVFIRDNCEKHVLRALARKSEVMKTVACSDPRLRDGFLYPGEYPVWDEAGTAERRDGAAMRIQTAWREVVRDPSYSMCRRRLVREFECMDDDNLTSA